MAETANTTDLVQTKPRGGVDILTVAFSIVVLMWGAGYFSRMPPPQGFVPAPVLLALLVLIQFCGGYFLGRLTVRSVIAAVGTGLITTLLNMLILGAVLADDHTFGEILLGVAGFTCVSVITTLIGFAVGKKLRPEQPEHINWTGKFAIVTVFATFILIIAGGLVTGWEAGLAVVDWPNTEGNLMFLYPLSKMTGGIYYEHAHRLYGALVGLTTMALVYSIWRSELIVAPYKKKLRTVAIFAFILVAIQGYLGGMRVTGELTLSTDPAETSPNITLAIVHGVLAQIFLALIVAIAAFTSLTWWQRANVVKHPSAEHDRIFSKLLVGAVIIQIALGATFRHLFAYESATKWIVHAILTLHLLIAALLLGLIIYNGVRAAALYKDQPRVRKTGKMLLHALILQLLLGIAAVGAVFMRDASEQIPAWEVIITTMHQAMGALILASSVLYAVWVHRFLEPAGESV